MKPNCTVQWAEQHIRKDVCRLNSKLTSTTDTQIESGQTKVSEELELTVVELLRFNCRIYIYGLVEFTDSLRNICDLK